MLAAGAFALTAGCAADGESADRTICEAVSSVDANASAEDAEEAVRAIRNAGRPDSEVLVAVQTHVERVHNQIALSARFEDLEAACEAEGVPLDLPAERP